MASRRPGLLESFGLPQSEEELLRQRVNEGLLEARQGVAKARFGSPSERLSADIGSQLGTALGFKLSGLSPEDKARAKIVEDANNDFKKIRDTVSEEAQGTEYMKSLARAASKNGDHGLAAEVMLSATQQEIARASQEAELRRLGLAGDRTEQVIDLSTSDEARRKAGEFNAFLPMDPDGTFDVENMENKMVTGSVDEFGRLNVTAPNGEQLSTTQYLTANQALQMRDRLNAARRGGKQPDPLRDFFSALTPTDRKVAREKVDSVNGQIKIMDSVADKFTEMAREGIAASSIVGNVGTINRIVNSIASQFEGAKSTYKAWIADDDGDSVVRFTGKGAVGDQIVQSGKYDSLIDQIRIPEAIAASGRDAAEYRAMIVELAYATARANEPGARQLSDQDFRRALEQIGAATQDPATFAQVVFNNMSRKADSVSSEIGRIQGIARAVGLDPGRGLQLIYGTSDFDDFDKRLDEIDTKYQNLGFWLSGQDPNAVSSGGVSGRIE